MNSDNERLKKETEGYSLPAHLAIILDGNGRWATGKGYSRNEGHRAGARNLIDICRYAREIGIGCLTVFAFSTENRKRPPEEVNYLMQLSETLLKERKRDIKKENIRFRVIGRREELKPKLLKAIEDAEKEAEGCTGMRFNVAFDYGSHEEIVRAARRIAIDCEKGEISSGDIDEELFGKYLYTEGLPPVDLLIRPGGEQRISNFLLWQIAYGELWFSPVLWPDFSPADLNAAIIEYNKRERRFGDIK